MRTIRLPLKGTGNIVTNHRIFSNIKLLLVEFLCNDNYLSVVLSLLCHALSHYIDLDGCLIIDRNYGILFLYSEGHNFLDRAFSLETFVLCCNSVITISYSKILARPVTSAHCRRTSSNGCHLV